MFHKDCLKEAKSITASCPLCRTNLTPNSKDHKPMIHDPIESLFETTTTTTMYNTNSSNSYNAENPIVQAAQRARNAVRQQLLRNSSYSR